LGGKAIINTSIVSGRIEEIIL